MMIQQLTLGWLVYDLTGSAVLSERCVGGRSGRARPNDGCTWLGGCGRHAFVSLHGKQHYAQGLVFTRLFDTLGSFSYLLFAIHLLVSCIIGPCRSGRFPCLVWGHQKHDGTIDRPG